MLAEAYIHRLDPFVLRFTETFGIRWYGLAYLTGFLIAWLLMRWLAKTRRIQLTPEDISDYLFYGILGVIVGGRLGYCIFYQPRLLIDPPIIGILQIWRGGMASHGGMIGVVVATILFARRRRHSALHILDTGALVCPIGLGLGRVANFVNAELWGRPLPEAMRANPPWWSVKYPTELLQPAVQSAHAKEIAGLKHLVEGASSVPEALVAAAKQGSEPVIEGLRSILTPYYPSQIYQAISDGPVLFFTMLILWLFPLKPGCVGGGFLVTYGILRIFTEVYRQPDEGVDVLATPLGDLSRGQLLSVAMVVAGIAMVWLCARRDAKPLGRLLHPPKD